MARLPTVESFGARPSQRSPRGVVGVRAGIAETAQARALSQEAAGIRQSGDALAGIADIAGAFADKFAEEDAKREARDLDTEYSNAIRELQRGDGTDENPGYLNLAGENAVNGREDHITALEDLHKTMLERASSDRVGELVGRAFNSRFKSALDGSAVHFGGQRRVANKASFDAHQAAIADDAAVAGAAGDADGVEDLAMLAGAQAAENAQETGADPTLAAEAAITDILKSEIERRALTDPAAAREFFEEHKDDIDGREHGAVEVFLERADRQALAELEKSERAVEKELKEARSIRAAELTDGILEGTTTDADLDAALENREINGSQFIAARKLLKAQESDDAIQDDPYTVLTFTEQLEDGSLTANQVMDAYRDKQIKSSTMNRFRGEIDASPDDFKVKEQRRILKENVGGVSGLGAILGEKATRKVNQAIEEFNERVRLLEEDPLVVRKDIESRAAEPRSLESLFRPRFMVGADKETMDVAATKKATLKEFRAGRITRNQLNREVDIIKQIDAARQRER